MCWTRREVFVCVCIVRYDVYSNWSFFKCLVSLRCTFFCIRVHEIKLDRTEQNEQYLIGRSITTSNEWYISLGTVTIGRHRFFNVHSYGNHSRLWTRVLPMSFAHMHDSFRQDQQLEVKQRKSAEYSFKRENEHIACCIHLVVYDERRSCLLPSTCS
jgi:hypothetical protein